MYIPNFDLETALVILAISVLSQWLASMGILRRIHQDRLDSQSKLTTFLFDVFLPIVQEREVAQNPPQGGNNNGPPTPLSVDLDRSICW